MAKVTALLSTSLLVALATEGTSVKAFTVSRGASNQARLERASVDEHGSLELQFDDPQAEEDREAEVLWDFHKRVEELPRNLLFLVKDLKLAEVTSWGSGTRLRFVGGDPRFVVKFDFPMSGLQVNVPHEGPFFIACGEDK